MTYNINYSDSSKPSITIDENTLDTTTSLELLGQNYASGYGEIVATNFLHLLENFSSPTAPINPIIGQIWFDSQVNVLKVYNVNQEWKELATTRSSNTDPNITGSEKAGDLFVNDATKQVFVYMGGEWNLVFQDTGSSNVAQTKTRIDSSGGPHITYEITVNGKTVIVVSSDNTSWTPNASGSTPEVLSDGTIMANVFPTIEPGINLYNRKPSEVTVSETNPNTNNPYLKTGDFWINSATKETWVYNQTAWLKLSDTKLETRAEARQRLDNNGILHQTLETIVNGKIIFIDSADETPYVLAVSELDESGNPLVNTFTDPIVLGRNAIPVPETPSAPTQPISYVPTGAIQAFAMQIIPSGWLACNGTAVSRTEYSRLFNLIGTTYGTGNGSTTFNLPDLRGEFIRGWDNGRGIDINRDFASSQEDTFKSHSHGTSRIEVDDDDGGIDHWVMTQSGEASTVGTFETDSIGDTETRPRNIALMYCIKS